MLVVHGQSGRSRVGTPPRTKAKDSLVSQFETPYGVTSPVNTFTLPAVRYLHDTGTSLEQLAEVVVAQSRWSDGNPKASRPGPATVDEVMSAPMAAYPFTKLECCVRTDGGGVLIVTTAERARDLKRAPIHVQESVRQLRGEAFRQVPGITTSLVQGIGGMFTAAATLILASEVPR